MYAQTIVKQLEKIATLIEDTQENVPDWDEAEEVFDCLAEAQRQIDLAKDLVSQEVSVEDE